MTAKELKAAIEERDRALREAQKADARARSAEESRAKMEADMCQLKELQQRARECRGGKGPTAAGGGGGAPGPAQPPGGGGCGDTGCLSGAVGGRPGGRSKGSQAGSRQGPPAGAGGSGAEGPGKREEAPGGAQDGPGAGPGGQYPTQEAELAAKKAEKKASDADRLAKVSANENMVTFRVLFQSRPGHGEPHGGRREEGKRREPAKDAGSPPGTGPGHRTGGGGMKIEAPCRLGQRFHS